MDQLEALNSFLSGCAMPLLLISVGVYFAFRLKFYWILHPVRFVKDLINAGKGSGTSPFKALTVALAGTLGVGNISGVASAITAGGAGSVFWMWVAAFASMSVKYVEVFLAVEYRKERKTQNGTEHFGGAPYYIKEGLSFHLGRKRAGILSVIFALILVSNSLITGNIVQVNAAASVSDLIPKPVIGLIFALILVVVTVGGAKRVGDFAFRVIPLLSVMYLAFSLFIIFTNLDGVSGVFSLIFREAFSFRAAAGGVVGYGVSKAVRFGVTRGVFSNEAGCGTAPTAHASADTKSPHHQACFGIFEVFCDTVVLCTVTAVVILLADIKCGESIPLVMYSYGSFIGQWGEIFIGVSVVIFALATVICQSYYGIEALKFITDKKVPLCVYITLGALCSVAGSVIAPAFMWQSADLQISLMTVINTLTVFILSDEVFRSVKKYTDKK